MGVMTIDLRGVNFAGRTVSVTATVALGTLTIEVPPGVQVDLVAESGSSGINYPQGQQQFDGTRAGTTDTSHLNLTVKVALGTINLVRAAPGSNLFGELTQR
jgi:predicted membrane protein